MFMLLVFLSYYYCSCYMRFSYCTNISFEKITCTKKKITNNFIFICVFYWNKYIGNGCFTKNFFQNSFILMFSEKVKVWLQCSMFNQNTEGSREQNFDIISLFIGTWWMNDQHMMRICLFNHGNSHIRVWVWTQINPYMILLFL